MSDPGSTHDRLAMPFPSPLLMPSVMPFGQQRFQVFALDGGGAKALFTAHVLAHL